MHCRPIATNHVAQVEQSNRELQKLRDDFARVVAQKDAAENGIVLAAAAKAKPTAGAAFFTAKPAAPAAAPVAQQQQPLQPARSVDSSGAMGHALLSAGVAMSKTGRNGQRYRRLVRWASESARLEWTDKVDGSGWRGVSTQGAKALVRGDSLTVTTKEARGVSCSPCTIVRLVHAA